MGTAAMAQQNPDISGGHMTIRRLLPILSVTLFVAACSQPSPVAPTRVTAVGSSGASAASNNAEQPPFNLEAKLTGDGFGLVTFRQQKDPAANVIALGVWVRDLLPDTSYILQRATDTTLDGVCTGTNWLTLGKGLTPASIETDGTGTGRAELSRDLSAFAPGSAFDIHFRVIQNATAHVALETGCHRFVVRD
jgi:hypothetical protein